MVNKRIEIYKVNENYKDRVKEADFPEIEKKYLINFLDQCLLGKINVGKKLSLRRIHRYIDMLLIPLEYWNKETTKISIKEIEDFDKALTSDKIKKRDKGDYASETKAGIRRAIKIYFKWRLGEEKAHKLVGWFDLRRQRKTPDFLNEKEVELLYRSCRNERERFLIAVLFDTGARAGEFFNIRFEDLAMPNDSNSFIKINLKEEYSKTKGRNISLFWKYSPEAIRDYLKLRKEKGITLNEPIYEGTYNQARAFIRRLGESKLKKNIHFHLFRHSSATYFADKLNRQQLCVRYGWNFSSDMPDVYISRAGVADKELDDKMAGTEVEKIKDDFIKKEQEFKIEMDKMKTENKETLELLKEDIKSLKVLRAISQYRKFKKTMVKDKEEKELDFIYKNKEEKEEKKDAEEMLELIEK